MVKEDNSSEYNAVSYSQSDGTRLRLPGDELLPCLVAFKDDLDGVLFALGLARESKDVLPSVRDV